MLRDLIISILKRDKKTSNLLSKLPYKITIDLINGYLTLRQDVKRRNIALKVYN